MRGWLLLGLLAMTLGCGKKTEPTTDTPPSGWSPPSAISNSERAINGTWIVDREGDDEGSKPAEANWTLTFKEGTLSTTRNKEVTEGTYRLNSSTNPKEIDLTTIEEGKPIVIKGLFEFREDKLLLVMPERPSLPRPSGIKPPAKRSVYILELIRKP